VRSMPFATLLQVPSPPTATMRRKPRPIASSARRASSPGPCVRACSSFGAGARCCRTGWMNWEPRPLPECGLKTTKTGSSSYFAPSSFASGSKSWQPFLIHSSRNGVS
jgi:hypothetical protein